MNEQEIDLDNLDNLLEDFDDVTVEGGVDSENDDGCEGGACKIETSGRLNIRKQTIYTIQNTKETTSWHTAIK